MEIIGALRKFSLIVIWMGQRESHLQKSCTVNLTDQHTLGRITVPAVLTGLLLWNLRIRLSIASSEHFQRRWNLVPTQPKTHINPEMKCKGEGVFPLISYFHMKIIFLTFTSHLRFICFSVLETSLHMYMYHIGIFISLKMNYRHVVILIFSNISIESNCISKWQHFKGEYPT